MRTKRNNQLSPHAFFVIVKNRSLVLFSALIVIGVFGGMLIGYFKTEMDTVSPAVINNSSSVSTTPMPTATYILDTLTPTTNVISSPTIVRIAPTLMSKSTPIVKMTSGELGFHVPDTAHTYVSKGDCGQAITITSKGSTSFHIDQMQTSLEKPEAANDYLYWQNSQATIEPGSFYNLFICVQKDAPYCDYRGCKTVKFHDDTTGAVKEVRACALIKCN